MEGKRPEIRFKGYDDEWVSKRFGDAFDFISNNTLSRDNLNNESGAVLNVHYGDVLIKFGEYLDVQKEQLPFISDEALVSKFQASLLRDGDVIIADTDEDTTVGKCTEIVCVDGKKIISGLHTMACRPKEKYTLRFLGYCLNSPKYHKNLLPLMQGVKVLSISKSGISDTNIVISENRDEQGKIANFLAVLDREIKAELLKCEKLVILKKAMLKKMFPAAERKVPEIRFDGYTDDWERRKFPEFVSFFNGLTYTPDDVQETGTLVLRSSNVKNGEIVDADNVYVSDKVAISENVQEGDIIVVVRNGSRALIGKHAQIKASMPNTVIGAFMSGIRSEHSSFVNALLDTAAFENEIAKNMGATINQITGYMFSKMEFMIPSEKEQQRIGDYFSHLDNLITLHQCKVEKLKNIKSACIKKMFV